MSILLVTLPPQGSLYLFMFEVGFVLAAAIALLRGIGGWLQAKRHDRVSRRAFLLRPGQYLGTFAFWCFMVAIALFLYGAIKYTSRPAILAVLVFGVLSFFFIALWLGRKKDAEWSNMCVILSVFAAITTATGFHYLGRTLASAPFEGHIAAFSVQPSRTDYGHSYVKGKVLAVNKDSEDVDDFFWHLPSSMRAKDWQDVSTVLLVSCHEDETGTYGSGASGFQSHCTVKVVDYQRQVIVDTHDFDGPMPPKSITSNQGDQHPGRPTGKMVDWVENLPKR